MWLALPHLLPIRDNSQVAPEWPRQVSRVFSVIGTLGNHCVLVMKRTNVYHSRKGDVSWLLT